MGRTPQAFTSDDPITGQLDRLLDIHQIAELMQASPTTIDRMWRAGEFPKPTYIGTSKRWYASAYNAWIARRRAEDG